MPTFQLTDEHDSITEFCCRYTHGLVLAAIAFNSDLDYYTSEQIHVGNYVWPKSLYAASHHKTLCREGGLICKIDDNLGKFSMYKSTSVCVSAPQQPRSPHRNSPSQTPMSTYHDLLISMADGSIKISLNLFHDSGRIQPTILVVGRRV
nr:hypothetical protein HmN_000209100 [Hymenolepis microstoma]